MHLSGDTIAIAFVLADRSRGHFHGLTTINAIVQSHAHSCSGSRLEGTTSPGMFAFLGARVQVVAVPSGSGSGQNTGTQLLSAIDCPQHLGIHDSNVFFPPWTPFQEPQSGLCALQQVPPCCPEHSSLSTRRRPSSPFIPSAAMLLLSCPILSHNQSFLNSRLSSPGDLT